MRRWLAIVGLALSAWGAWGETVTITDSSVAKSGSVVTIQGSLALIPSVWAARADTYLYSAAIRSNGQITIITGTSTSAAASRDFVPAVETDVLLRFQSGSNVLIVAGPNAPSNTSRDTTEPYIYTPANSAEVTAFYNAVSNGDSGTATLKYPAPPTLPAVSAQTVAREGTFVLPAHSGGAGLNVVSQTFNTRDVTGFVDPGGWNVQYVASVQRTTVRLGGGDYRDRYEVGQPYRIDIDGTQTALGNLVSEATANSNTITNLVFAGNPLGLSDRAFATGSVLKTLRHDASAALLLVSGLAQPIQTRTARPPNNVVNTDVEWGIYYNFTQRRTWVHIGGGDYRSSYDVGSAYAVDIDGTVTQLGNLAFEVMATAGGYFSTVLQFPGNPFGLADNTFLTSGNTLKTLRTDAELSIDQATRTVTVPATAPLGAHTITYTATDEDGADWAASRQFQLTVTEGGGVALGSVNITGAFLGTVPVGIAVGNVQILPTPSAPPDPAIHTRTVRVANEGLVNTDTEWVILRTSADNSTFIVIGGGDYTGDYTVGDSYAADVDGTVTQMGNLAEERYVSGSPRLYTFLRFSGDPYNLGSGAVYLSTGNTLKTIEGN